MSEQNSRFSGAPWYIDINRSIQVFGCGGIGSNLAYFIARAGFSVYLYDFDFLETGNFSGQMFSKNYIGETKVSALSKTIKDLCILNSGQTIDIRKERVTESTSIPLYVGSRDYFIVCSCFDNMRARKDLFNYFLKTRDHMSEQCSTTYSMNKNKYLFIDGRLSLENFQIFCIKGDDEQAIGKYQEEALFDDSAVPDDVCSLKQTSHIAAMIGAQMFAFITNFITNVEDGVEGRTVPFKYEYFSPLALQNIVELPPAGNASINTEPIIVNSDELVL